MKSKLSGQPLMSRLGLILLGLATTFTATAAPIATFTPTQGLKATATSDGKTAVSASAAGTLYCPEKANLVSLSDGLDGPGGRIGPGNVTVPASIACAAKTFTTVVVSVLGL